MTTTEIQNITTRHLEAWFADRGDERLTLRQHFSDAITEAVAETNKLWAAGANTLRFERDKAQAELAAVRAALSCQSGENTENVARKLYHDCVDYKYAAERWKAKAEECLTRIEATVLKVPAGKRAVEL